MDKFDNLIKKNLNNRFQVELSDNFTEKVISQILTEARNPVYRPLISNKVVVVIVTIITSILVYLSIVNMPESSGNNVFPYITEIVFKVSNFVHSTVHDYFYLYLVVVILLVFDLILRKSFSRRIYRN
ncbi:hypothetical protein MASR1M45_12780 [Candidatus Kapaibacterium sp.]